MTRRIDSAVASLGAVGAYNVLQHALVSDRAYVAANLAVAAGLASHARHSGLSYDDLGLSLQGVGRGLAFASPIVAAVGLGAVVSVKSPVGRRWLMDDRARGQERAEVAHQVGVRIPLGTALFEEIVFRGVLDGLWRHSRSDGAARTVTALAFGAWHLIPTFRLLPGMAVGSDKPALRERIAASIGVGVLTTLAGLGFTWVRERSGSVSGPWLVHAGVNGLFYLAARRAWQLAEE